MSATLPPTSDELRDAILDLVDGVYAGPEDIQRHTGLNNERSKQLWELYCFLLQSD